MSPIITCNNLCKNFKNPIKEAGLVASLKSFIKPQYKHVPAIQDFSFEIQRGEFVGLLGPNGAGKTTLMKMLSGVVMPSSGELSVLGSYPFDRTLDFRKKIALVMGQKSQLWWDIPAIDSFHLLASYYEIEQEKFKNKLAILCDHLQVEHVLNTAVRKLSLGERMKMELIACLLHDPELIFLDEPTIGLDLNAQDAIREFLADYQQQTKCTIILTSHYMADIQALCERIILVMDGQKRFDDSIDRFQTLLGNQKLLNLRFYEPVDSDDDLWKGLDPEWGKENLSVELKVPIDQLNHILGQIIDTYPLRDIQTEKLAIEKVMKHLMNSTQYV